MDSNRAALHLRTRGLCRAHVGETGVSVGCLPCMQTNRVMASRFFVRPTKRCGARGEAIGRPGGTTSQNSPPRFETTGNMGVPGSSGLALVPVPLAASCNCAPPDQPFRDWNNLSPSINPSLAPFFLGPDSGLAIPATSPKSTARVQQLAARLHNHHRQRRTPAFPSVPRFPSRSNTTALSQRCKPSC